MQSEDIILLSIKELFSGDRYLIPIYQRNYDWGEKEAMQLIQDIADFASSKVDKKYYIGSLVVFVRIKDGQEYFETIDGQQRLTTLTILLNVLRKMPELNERIKWFSPGRLSYDHRPESDDTLRMLFDGKSSDCSSDNSIVDVYKIFQKNTRNVILDKGLTLETFCDYLLNNVIIMRIPVPRDTELNHYFEIMNSRGEQLEKHEVLKASLMDLLDESCHLLFNDIWEACSSLSSYVQMNFKPNVRSLIFSENWAELKNYDFDTLNNLYSHLDDNEDTDDADNGYICRSLSQLFEDAAINRKYPLPASDYNEEGNDRFGSIINFSNLLLHALKVMYHSDKEYDKDIDSEIRLDDKRLVDIFVLVLGHCKDQSSFVKRYIIALLTIRSLFDRFVIKRENYNGKVGWSLKDIKKYERSKINYVGSFNGETDDDSGISKDIRMLEAMFHVSAPTQIYKHWMNAVLYYVYNQKQVEPVEFRNYLYSLACAYMLDRYLCLKDDRIDFEEIIYKNSGVAHNSQISWDMIDSGCNVENFVFNFYDYVTWKMDNKGKYSRFDFTYRTSVEHFYPQTPLAGNPELKDEDGLNDFGNLCLISRGMNSKFSNNMPMAKYKNFGNEALSQELSIKLHEMMDVVRTKGDWGKEEIADFERQSRDRILSAIREGVKNEIKEDLRTLDHNQPL